MFFWMVLASLMGIVMFGNWRENIKDQADFVAPVYQAMALSTYQQHLAAERGYQDAFRLDPVTAKNALNGKTNVNLITVKNGTKTINAAFPRIAQHLPPTYKPQNGTRSYLFCIPRNQDGETTCDDDEAVKYIVTVRPVPPKYDGAAKMTSLNSIAEATSGSRFIGMLQKATVPLTESAGTRYQPLGAQYYILSGGTSEAGHVYIPNYVTCKFPLDESGKVLGSHLDQSYIVALSLMGGLGDQKNLTAGENWPCSGGG